MIITYELWDITTANLIEYHTSPPTKIDYIVEELKWHLINNVDFPSIVDIQSVIGNSKFRIVWHDLKWFVQAMTEVHKLGQV